MTRQSLFRSQKPDWVVSKMCPLARSLRGMDLSRTSVSCTSSRYIPARPEPRWVWPPPASIQKCAGGLVASDFCRALIIAADELGNSFSEPQHKCGSDRTGVSIREDAPSTDRSGPVFGPQLFRGVMTRSSAMPRRLSRAASARRPALISSRPAPGSRPAVRPWTTCG